MATPLDQQKAIMAQRMGQSAGMGAPQGGLPTGGMSPPPASQGQQTPGGAPQSSRLEPLLQQVMQILVEGNPADLEAFGKFMAQLQQLVQEHGMGQGASQVTPMGGAMPGGMQPQLGG
jgi:hypothetical protein